MRPWSHPPPTTQDPPESSASRAAYCKPRACSPHVAQKVEGQTNTSIIMPRVHTDVSAKKRLKQKHNETCVYPSPLCERLLCLYTQKCERFGFAGCWNVKTYNQHGDYARAPSVSCTYWSMPVKINISGGVFFLQSLNRNRLSFFQCSSTPASTTMLFAVNPPP